MRNFDPVAKNNDDFKPVMLHEFTANGFAERVGHYITNQNFCDAALTANLASSKGGNYAFTAWCPCVRACVCVCVCMCGGGGGEGVVCAFAAQLWEICTVFFLAQAGYLDIT